MQIKAIWKQNVRYQHLEGMRGTLNLSKVSSFIVPGVSSGQSAQDSGIPFVLDGDYRWIFSVVGSLYSWKHKPLTFCSLLGVATVSDLGEGDTTSSFQRGRGCERGHKGWAQGSCRALRLCKSPLSPQEPGKPWAPQSPLQPLVPRCPLQSMACPSCAMLDQDSDHCAKTDHKGKVKRPLFIRFVLVLGFLGVFFNSSNTKALQGRC